VRRSSDPSRLAEAGFEIVKGDVRDPRSVDQAVEGVDQVYHLAAAFRIAAKPARYYWDVNVGGTKNVIFAAKRHDVARVVHCSTVGVHGHVGRIPADETSPFNPGDIYQRTKLEAELHVAEALAGGLKGVVFRPGAIYGPGDTRFLKLFRAVHRQHFVMLGSGEVHYHLVYIDDLVSGILLCGSEEQALGNVYILAGDEYVTLNRFVELVSGAVGVAPRQRRFPLWPVRGLAYACESLCAPLRIPPPLYPRRVDFFWKERAFRIDKAKRELGYAPSVGLFEGMKRTAEWYFQQGFLHRRADRHGIPPERD
jgi:nucleoside-diphosphate-sugar epimerase